MFKIFTFCFLALSCAACSFSSNSMKDLSPEQIQAKVAEAGAPSSSHRRLEVLKGSWRAKSKFWPTPDSQPLESTASLRRSWELGGRFLKEDYQDYNSKHPFKGIGFLGFDNVKQTYVYNWIDSMGTGIASSEGEFSQEDSAFKFNGKSTCPLTGGELKNESVLKVLSDRKNILEMYQTQNGKKHKTLEIIYEKF